MRFAPGLKDGTAAPRTSWSGHELVDAARLWARGSPAIGAVAPSTGACAARAAAVEAVEADRNR